MADYLDQTGRHERSGVYPPERLWTTFAATVTDSALLRHLGEQAQSRCRYQHAIWLYTRAAERGNAGAMRDLAKLREHAGDAPGAETLYRQAADRGEVHALWGLAAMRERAGDAAGAEALAVQAADRGYTTALSSLAGMREQAGDTAGADQTRKFGLTGSGDVATMLDFDF